MKLPNEMKQINEVIRRLNYYEKGLVAGDKIKRQSCNLCGINSNGPYGKNCSNCLANLRLFSCVDGSPARRSISIEHNTAYSKKVIRDWQTELRRRANKNLKAAGSKWCIEWEREE